MLRTNTCFFRLSVISPNSNNPSVTGVPASRLRLPDNLDHLRSPQAQVFGHWVVDPDPRQLCLFQAVSAEQVSLLFRAEQHVLGHELVLADVDQEVVFLEDFEDGWEERGDDFQSGWGDFCAGDEDTCSVQLAQWLGHTWVVVPSFKIVPVKYFFSSRS